VSAHLPALIGWALFVAAIVAAVHLALSGVSAMTPIGGTGS
jgi:hypothetical protein